MEGIKNHGVSSSATGSYASSREPGPPDKRTARLVASKELKRLIDLPTEQIKMYPWLYPPSKRLLLLAPPDGAQFSMDSRASGRFPRSETRGLAKMVAVSYNKGSGIARRIVQWEKTWIRCRTISEKRSRSKSFSTIWMNEDNTCAVRDFARTRGT